MGGELPAEAQTSSDDAPLPTRQSSSRRRPRPGGTPTPNKQSVADRQIAAMEKLNEVMANPVQVSQSMAQKNLDTFKAERARTQLIKDQFDLMTSLDERLQHIESVIQAAECAGAPVSRRHAVMKSMLNTELDSLMESMAAATADKASAHPPGVSPSQASELFTPPARVHQRSSEMEDCVSAAESNSSEGSEGSSASSFIV